MNTIGKRIKNIKPRISLIFEKSLDFSICAIIFRHSFISRILNELSSFISEN
tara:strand:+ start:10682 stop:10837 length:156 start_codon:yes stop_codon:yes gene_type:complete